MALALAEANSLSKLQDQKMKKGSVIQKILIDYNNFKGANLLAHPRLYVGKLNENVKKQDLISAFSQYGEILDILMKDDFAFLEFSNVQAATRALLDMNGLNIWRNFEFNL